MSENVLTAYFATWQKRYDELSDQLSSGAIDPVQRQVLQKEHAQLSTLLAKYREIQVLEQQVIDNKKQREASVSS